jgi:hypothetical protein
MSCNDNPTSCGISSSTIKQLSGSEREDGDGNRLCDDSERNDDDETHDVCTGMNTVPLALDGSGSHIVNSVDHNKNDDAVTRTSAVEGVVSKQHDKGEAKTSTSNEVPNHNGSDSTNANDKVLCGRSRTIFLASAVFFFVILILPISIVVPILKRNS